eukprot:12446702-Alexandrium_andersonii.AAC.1
MVFCAGAERLRGWASEAEQAAEERRSQRAAIKKQAWGEFVDRCFLEGIGPICKWVREVPADPPQAFALEGGQPSFDPAVVAERALCGWSE